MNSTSTAAKISLRLLTGFDDPAWERFSAPSVFQTPQWQQAWWENFGRGRQLLLVLAEEDGQPVALAPLFADSGMIYPVASGGSDYLDFLGDVSNGRLAHMLRFASEQVPDFQGFVLYHVPDASPTGAHLKTAAEQLGWPLFDEGEQPAPAMDLVGRRDDAIAATRKKSLVRHENGLRREGTLEIRQYRTGRDIIPQLEAFFAQHIARWSPTPHPSLFLDPAQRAFYRRFCELAGESGWLRFTRVDLNGKPIAFHLGFCYRDQFMWYKPTFDVELARSSPGEVLLRQLLLAALEEGAKGFDFGLGDEAFKARFATQMNTVRNWGLYPPHVVNRSREAG